jgi:hypothetical protein
MRLSEKTKNCLLAPFAISPIMQRFSLPGLFGVLLFAVGAWLHIDWLKVTGIILTVPIIWVYAVIMLVYFPYLIFDSIRRRLNKTK